MASIITAPASVAQILHQHFPGQDESEQGTARSYSFMCNQGGCNAH